MSGNPRGRPKGLSIKRLTQKIALTKQVVTTDGKPQKFSRLEIAILEAQALAAMGKPAAALLISELRVQTGRGEPERDSGVLLVPEQLTMEAFIAEEEARNATKVEPGTASTSKRKHFSKPCKASLRSMDRRCWPFIASTGASV
jgi:hypothetical protein